MNRGIKKWNATKCSKYPKEIKIKAVRLKELQDCDDPSNLDEIRSIQLELNILLEQENLMWKHKAKKCWYRWGDKTQKFFMLVQTREEKKTSSKASAPIPTGSMNQKKK